MRIRVLGIVIAATLVLAQAPGPPNAAPEAQHAAAPAQNPTPPPPHAEPVAPRVVHVPADAVVAILGQPVAGPDGKSLGRLIDVLVNEDGKPTAAVIDVGGFMGVGARKIAVRWNALHFAPGATKTPISLDWSIDQIKAAPEYGSPSKPAPVVVAAPKAAPVVVAAPKAAPKQQSLPAPSGPR